MSFIHNNGFPKKFTGLSVSTRRVSARYWSGWEPHKVLSYERGDGNSQG